MRRSSPGREDERLRKVLGVVALVGDVEVDARDGRTLDERTFDERGGERSGGRRAEERNGSGEGERGFGEHGESNESDGS